MKRAVKITSAVLSVLCAGVFAVCGLLSDSLPDQITAYYDDKISFSNFITFSSINQLSDSRPVSVGASDCSDVGQLSLFSVIPVKDVSVRRIEEQSVILCGTLFGIKFYAKGAAVIRTCDIATENGSVNPGELAGLMPGDTITAANGEEIRFCSDLERITLESGEETLRLSCMRGGQYFETEITPAASDDGRRLGLWVRDSAAGLGTMTFCDPESGRFASLGHGICDSDTGELMELNKADITKVDVASITKSIDGSPGVINGYFDSGEPIGCATLNSECGLYGSLYAPAEGTLVRIAPAYEVKKGRAQLLCALDGGRPKLYDVTITKVDYNETNKTKNLQFEVTDERLTEKTGGIVQGMSGCPILQNGKLVGAATHVLLTNSEKGFGIFAQNMYEEMEKAQI